MSIIPRHYLLYYRIFLKTIAKELKNFKISIDKLENGMLH